MSLKIRNINNTYPKASELQFYSNSSTYLNTSLKIHCQLFGNCQAFGLVEAQVLLQIKKEELHAALLLIKGESGNKRLCFMDLNEKNVEPIRRLLKPYTKSFTTTKYKSTRNSSMRICIIKFKKEL